jgi:hypothetical protein
MDTSIILRVSSHRWRRKKCLPATIPYQDEKRHFQAQRNERGPVKTISLRMLVANVVVLLMCMAVGRAQTVTGTVTGSAVRSVERHLQFSANYRF